MNWKTELIGFGFGVAVSVLVAVATQLTDLQSFDKVVLTGIALTAVRSGATAVVTLLGRRVAGVSQ